MAKMCYRCMMPTVEGGVCKKCGEPDIAAQGNGPKALPPGLQLNGGRITVGKKLGSGGFGITYIAFDHKLNRRVALKEFLPNYMADREGNNIVPKQGNNEAYLKAMNSFRKEARALYELRGHPNIVHVINTFRENNTAYYTMELLDGESLLALLKRRKKISGEEAYKLLFPIMDAIRYMHRQNILHRDISPDNIMLCHDPGNPGRVIPKLIDFGAAHVAIEGYSSSYPGVKKNGFSPLEQNWAGKFQGPWTDIYSLCATFYGAVIGTVPTPAVDRAEAMNSAKGEDPLKPARQMGGDISEEMDSVLMKGLALNHQDRIQTMDELMRKLTDARNRATNETIIDLPQPETHESSRPVGRRIIAWILDTALGLGVSGVLGMMMVDGRLRAEDEPLRMIYLSIPLVLFLLNWILVKAAKGTLGQLLTGLKIQRDDMSEDSLGAGYAFLYALLHPGLIGMICGIVYIASGKRVGPLEGLCDGVIRRRGETTNDSFGAVVISKSVSKPVSQEPSSAIRQEPVVQIPEAPKPQQTPEVHPQEQKHAPVPPKPARAQTPTPKQAAQPAGRPIPQAAVKPVQQPGPKPAGQPAVPAPAAETAHLLIRKTDDSLVNMVGKILTIHSGDTLGKNPAMAKVVIPDPTISKLHCRFAYYVGRGWAVKDENSTNGTFVNEQRLPSGGIAPMKAGTLIRVGKEIIEFKG